MFRFLFNLIAPVLYLVATPFWLKKTQKRGGLSKRLWEKLSYYQAKSPVSGEANEGLIQMHVASVGEANIARKLITCWQEADPEQKFLVTVGTSTGFDLLEAAMLSHTRIGYAPLDLPPIVKRHFNRYRPQLLILVEQELWPNLLAEAKRRAIPIALCNARLSPRSADRLKKFRWAVGKMYQHLDWVGLQVADDGALFERVGINSEKLHTMGSIKFDPATATPTAPSLTSAKPILSRLGKHPILMALSTHAGEELLFAKAAQKCPQVSCVIIPRHVERAKEILKELREAGFEVILRSTLKTEDTESLDGKVLLVDSTGEMPAFTPLATICFVGKTLTSSGGQNPCEAIAAKVPVIAGPHFENFEPLVTTLRENKGIKIIKDTETLAAAMQELLSNAEAKNKQSDDALLILEEHRGATAQTVSALSAILSKTQNLQTVS